MTTTKQPDNELEQLAHQINALHDEGEAAVFRGLDHFRAAGELLIQAKERCGHGRWLPWLKKNFRFSERTASRYMRLAHRWDEVAKAGCLTLNAALDVLVSRAGEDLANDRQSYVYRSLPLVPGIGADSVVAELERIRVDAGGDLTPSIIVEAAKDPKSLLHGGFSWDAKAGQKARMDQARKLVRGVCVIPGSEPEKEPEPLYVHVQTEQGPVYKPVAEVAGQADLLRSAFQELNFKLRLARHAVAQLESAAKRAGDKKTQQQAARVREHLAAAESEVADHEAA